LADEFEEFGFHYEGGNPMFKKILLAAVLGAGAVFGGQQASADVYVRGYFRSNGSYVAPHFRSDPDGNFFNNWSTYPNINPYTGRRGTRLTPPHAPRTSWPSYRLPRIAPSYGWPK
jgi:hypothetical protein